MLRAEPTSLNGFQSIVCRNRTCLGKDGNPTLQRNRMHHVCLFAGAQQVGESVAAGVCDKTSKTD